MDYEQLLKSTSDMIDKKFDDRLKPITDKLDVIDLKQDGTSKKLENLRLDVAVSERDIRRDIHELKDEMETVIETTKYPNCYFIILWYEIVILPLTVETPIMLWE